MASPACAQAAKAARGSSVAGGSTAGGSTAGDSTAGSSAAAQRGGASSSACAQTAESVRGGRGSTAGGRAAAQPSSSLLQVRGDRSQEGGVHSGATGAVDSSSVTAATKLGGSLRREASVSKGEAPVSKGGATRISAAGSSVPPLGPCWPSVRADNGSVNCHELLDTGAKYHSTPPSLMSSMCAMHPRSTNDLSLVAANGMAL